MGDGDSKTHPTILAADPHSGKPLEKLEFVGHIKKE